MSLRFHFSTDDLARTTIATQPDPLWEVLLSLHLLQTDDAPEIYGPWRGRVRARLTENDRRLLELTPPEGYSPDFMTPAAARHGLEPGLRAIATTSPDRLRVDLRRLAERSAAPRWSRPLADGDQYLLRQLTSGIRRYHKRAIGPFWTAIRRQVDADLARRSPAYLTTGFGGLVARLHPEMCWRSPTLEVGIGRIEADVELSGRGLRIIPSYFCWQHPIVLRDSRLRPVLVYPIAQSPLSAAETPDLAAGLTALMGRTRTAVLQTVARGACSTTTLAERAGISRASASEHARVLHQAGLIITRRNGLAVEHTITPTGLSLLGAP